MKFPSLSKLPSNKRFQFSPRYYDPVKEEVEAKIASARRELNKSEESPNLQDMKDRISGSFARKRSSESKKSFLIQAFIAILLSLLFLAVLKF